MMTYAASPPDHEAATTGPDLSKLAAVRAITVSIGPSILLDLFVTASTAVVAIGRFRRSGRGPDRPLALFGALLPWVYFLAIRPWHRRWGATNQELQVALPGDELVPEPGYQHTRAVTINAPAEQVWPWLAQIGQDRGGFYSYERLENLAGCDIRNADRVHPEWQDLHVGDTVALVRGWGPPVAEIQPGRVLVIEGWGAFIVQPVDDRTSRLIARGRQPRGWASWVYLLALEIPHFIMERKMLLGLKQRAEQAVASGTLLDQVLPNYDFRGSVSTVIQAPPAAILRAVREVTLAEMPLAYALGTLRYLPGLVTGRTRRRPDAATRPFFESLASPLLAEDPDRELVVGTIGKLHDLLDQQFVPLDSPAAFQRFDQPDYEKFIQSLRINGGDDAHGYTLLAEHRTQVLGSSARWKFALYWYLLVGWSGNLLLRMLLDAVKRRAERAIGPDRS